MISQDTIDEILSETKVSLADIFGQNLIFGFVCGGFSKGYADENHDVDIFVCVNKNPDKKLEERYLKWYFDLHKRYGIKADYDYPGEIVPYEYLIQTLSMLRSLKLTLEINDVRTKKAIIWADMLTGTTAAETGNDMEKLHQIKKEYAHYPEQWKGEVLRLINPDEAKIWRDKNHLLIMEKFMKYPKHDGKKLKGQYN